MLCGATQRGSHRGCGLGCARGCSPHTSGPTGPRSISARALFSVCHMQSIHPANVSWACKAGRKQCIHNIIGDDSMSRMSATCKHQALTFVTYLNFQILLRIISLSLQLQLPRIRHKVAQKIRHANSFSYQNKFFPQTKQVQSSFLTGRAPLGPGFRPSMELIFVNPPI